MARNVAIVGAGLCGNLMAIMLARRGLDVTVYDRGPPPAERTEQSGRSINLALAARGIRALEHAEAFACVEPLLLPMRGRIVHDESGAQRFLPYGQRRDEHIWSVSRAELNLKLYELARERWQVEHRFAHACTEFDVAATTAVLRAPAGGLATRGRTHTETRVAAPLIVAADGAGSTIRRALAAGGAVSASEDLLDHGYKELTIPATASGEFALEPGGLHIWPRGGFMLIALPNRDRSFTATLFLAHRGRPGFDTIGEPSVTDFFARHFADVLPLLPDLEREFSARPIGALGTVHCNPWTHSGEHAAGRRVLLVGDAAHAIVPFHGQGMNAAFEDCACLEQLVARHGDDWELVTREFERERQDNTRAIAEMALENYREMRDTVRDAAFERRARLAFELERRFAGRFVPRYSMVMFHPEIGYAEAERRGRIQAEILDRATAVADDAASLEIASRLVAERL